LAAHYVAVKLKMTDNQAAVKQYGVDRMPMDVVTTPRGQLVFKAISPQDPQQYVGQLMQVAFNVQRGTQQAALPTETSMNAGNPAATMASSMPPADRGTAPSSNNSPRYDTNPAGNLPSASPPIASAPPASGLPSNSTPTSKSATTDDRYADYYAKRQAANQDPAGPLTNSAPASNWPPQANNPAALAGSNSPANSSPAASGDSRYPPLGSATPSYNTQTNPSSSGYGEPASGPMSPSAQGSLYANQQASTTPAAPASPYAGLAGPAQNNLAPPQSPAQPPVAATNPPLNNPPYANQTVSGPSMQNLPPLPAGSPPLGLEGFCPVTLMERKTWTKGDPQWGAIHRGRTYLFTSQVEQQKFLANPDGFSPMLSGNDPVLHFGQNQQVQGRREHGVFYLNRVYLFSSEATLNEFQRQPSQFDAMVMQAMNPHLAPR
jgi:YHS domain-containing protein